MNTEQINPNIHKNTGVKRVFKALLYSFDGLTSTLGLPEAAFRQEVLLAASCSPGLVFSRASCSAFGLIASVLLVLIVELLNSAIEAVVDDISLRDRPLAKAPKT